MRVMNQTCWIICNIKVIKPAAQFGQMGHLPVIVCLVHEYFTPPFPRSLSKEIFISVCTVHIHAHAQYMLFIW